ncbi:SAM-dependent methyltransferase, partial [Nocardia noduli]|uniref:SAM-dependent methyltransferase n=1 Tax=Nocardia noduli TaxID=2815722 RepID=UPI001C21BEBC
MSEPTHPRVLDALLPLHLDHGYDLTDPRRSVGKDNLAVDQKMTARLDDRAPGFRASVHAGHVFLLRAVTELAGRGVRQYVILGCGYPRELNPGSAARRVIPEARVLYLDDGLCVSAYGRALHDTDTHYAHADPGDPAAILHAIDYTHHRYRRDGIDRAEPIAFVFGSLVLERLTDPATVIAGLITALPHGYMAATHICTDTTLDTAQHAATVYYEHALTMRPRTTTELTTLLAGIELLDPGLT